jgi:hypothetical protein
MIIRRVVLGVAVALVVIGCSSLPKTKQAKSEEGWISLFDGKTLNGWQANENTDTFKVADGAIVANGQRSHLFYIGKVEGADFKNFELKVDVMTRSNSNGGIYFHTKYQDEGWPNNGFEVQVNNTYNKDPRKTGSLYQVQDVLTIQAEDDKWFTEHIIVKGNRVVVKIDDRVVVDWRQDADYELPEDFPGRTISSGTFALQGHDPGSTVYYKNIRVKVLPEVDFPLVDYHVHLKGGLTLDEALAISKKNGVKFGIAQNCGIGFPVTDDASLREFVKGMKGKGVYVAMQAEGREWVTLFSPEAIAEFDYVFTDSMTWTDDKGHRMRLWMPEEVVIDDEQSFMDMLVNRIVKIMETEPIDIYVNSTYLPDRIAAQYDELWTQGRMQRVIMAAVRNNVAIEINARYRLPSKRFIQLAKKAGCKFSCGTNNGDKNLGNIEYCRRMIRECGLTQEDMFVPKPHNKKPIFTKGLPKK